MKGVATMTRKYKTKPILWLLFVLMALFVLSGCSKPSADPPTDVQNSVEMTAEELSVYNGKDGQPAYIAVDGVIYDVTDVPEWRGGGHNGFEAGRDLTNEIKNISPHGVTKLRGIPEVGVLID
jgi:predicted heme/steroid binding protein